MKKNTLFFLIIAVILFNPSCKNKDRDSDLTTEITFTKEGSATIYSLQDSIMKPVSELAIEIADNEYERQTGLMYRKEMGHDQAMLFIMDEEDIQSFYMKNTFIPLDLIFLDTSYKVVSIQKNAKPLDPSPLPSRLPAKYVLEINAGLSDKWNVKAGDSLAFQMNK